MLSLVNRPEPILKNRLGILKYYKSCQRNIGPKSKLLETKKIPLGEIWDVLPIHCYISPYQLAANLQDMFSPAPKILKKGALNGIVFTVAQSAVKNAGEAVFHESNVVFIGHVPMSGLEEY